MVLVVVEPTAATGSGGGAVIGSEQRRLEVALAAHASIASVLWANVMVAWAMASLIVSSPASELLANVSQAAW